MDTNAFRQRELALENEFFHKVDMKLLGNLRQQLQQEDARQSLATAAGISDDALLDELVELEIRAETLAAVALAPLVLVAWADGKVDPREHTAVLKSAEEQGVAPGSPGYEVLQLWLHNKPSDDLMPAWQHYVRAMSHSLSGGAMGQLKEKILTRSKGIAKESGGVWEMGKVSTGERRVLSALKKTFDEADS